MPKSNWKGVISFGLVNIPITLFNAIEGKNHVSFRQINKKTGATIKYKRIDSTTEKEVPWKDIGRAYQYSKEIILPVDDDELKYVAGENARTIAIEEFIDQNNIDLINVEHAYYLMPDKKAEKGYVILREALRDTATVGIAKVIISTKEYLAAVGIHDEALMLYLLHYNDEIKKISEFDFPEESLKKYHVKQTEIDIAKKLIQSMKKKWHPEKYKDEFKLLVDKWVQKKINHLPTKIKKAVPIKKISNVVSFVDLLKKSLKLSPAKKTKSVKYGVRKSKKVSHHKAIH